MEGSDLPGDGNGRRGRLRSTIHRAVPSHFNDPIGLALRIVVSRNPDALAAAFQAALRLALTPADAVLSLVPRSAGRTDPKGPVVFVTGPPRSGTTLLYQLLIRSLPVAYVTNLASLMPRSAARGAFPLTAAMVNSRVRAESYYGRTRALSGSSDGLEFWDAWIGGDRLRVPTAIEPDAAQAMRRFFGMFEERTGRPVLCKNNNLLAYAHLVADALPTARFLCLTREPVYLAQSLLKARRDIHGSDSVSYGIADQSGAGTDDPIADVWRQVGFYERLTADQRARIGADRFLMVSYEHLCEDPTGMIRNLARSAFDIDGLTVEIPALRPMKRQTLPDETFRALMAGRPS
jgi:hypothetical protein